MMLVFGDRCIIIFFASNDYGVLSGGSNSVFFFFFFFFFFIYIFLSPFEIEVNC